MPVKPTRSGWRLPRVIKTDLDFGGRCRDASCYSRGHLDFPLYTALLALLGLNKAARSASGAERRRATMRLMTVLVV